MKKLMTKLSVITTVGLFAVFPSPASAASGSKTCPPDEVVYTLAGGIGMYHYHTLNGSPILILVPDNTNNYNSYYYGWTARVGDWETHTSVTTLLSGAGCH